MLRKFFFLLLAFVTPYVHALDKVSTIQQPKGTIDFSTPDFSTPSGLVVTVIKYAIGIAGILGVIGITWGGIVMITSAGDDEKQKKSKFIIIYSIVGVVISGLAYSIVSVLSSVKV